MNKVGKFFITWLLGFFGVHKFIEKKYSIGIIYLFTLGLFGIGWFYDSIIAFIEIFKTEEPKEKKFKDFYIKLSHLMGLSYPEDAEVLITYNENNFSFSANNVEFSLPLERIKDLSIKTSKEIQQQYVSSIGGAATGAFLFGPLGAMIGGRAKKKNVKKITKCLIITYLKDNEMKYIAFGLDQFDEINAKELIKKFKKENTNVEITKFEI